MKEKSDGMEVKAKKKNGERNKCGSNTNNNEKYNKNIQKKKNKKCL